MWVKRGFLLHCRVDEDAKLDPTARRVYMINCLALILGALAGRPICNNRAAAVGELLEAHVSRLVGTQVSFLLARCGMAEIVERIR
jgi:conserved oligomeric Golgi complex subunit 6